MPARGALLLLALAAPAIAYWDGQIGTKDPMQEAMEMSKRAQHDPEALRKDPDYFRKLFGKLAIEQSQAKHMDEMQSTNEEQRCMACHGVVVEFEKMMIERKTAATGGLGMRGQLAVADAFEKICHLDRYETMDPLDPRKATQQGRRYGGLPPPTMANACKRVVEEWQDHDEIEQLLIDGGDAADMHRELREAVCNNREFGLCKNVPDEIGVSMSEGMQVLNFKGKLDQCGAEGGKKKKKKKKKVDPITGE